MAAPNFPVTTAQIVALFMECIFYGAYLVTLGHCLRALLFATDRNGLSFKRKINWPMLVVALLLALFATLDVAFGLRHNLDAFVYFNGPPEDELHNISYWVNVMKTADYVAQTFIGDAMLIYRCWIVFGRNVWVVIPSILLWLGGTTCGIILTYTFATLDSSTLINDDKASPFVDSMIALTLAMNILTTSLIVWRIWSVDRRGADVGLSTGATSRSRRVSSLHRIMRIIIDSAALYTVSVIVFVVTYVAGSNANYGTSDNVVQIIGIAFNLIIIRVDSGKSFNSDGTYGTTSMPQWNVKRRAPASTFPLSIMDSSTDGSEGVVSSPSAARIDNTSKDVHFFRGTLSNGDIEADGNPPMMVIEKSQFAEHR